MKMYRTAELQPFPFQQVKLPGIGQYPRQMHVRMPCPIIGLYTSAAMPNWNKQAQRQRDQAAYQ